MRRIRKGQRPVNCFACDQTVTAPFASRFQQPWFREAWLQQLWFRLPGPRSSWSRSLAVFVALTLSLFISAEGADARLKSEWKFGGSLARFISLPFGSALLGSDFSGDDVVGDVSNAGPTMLPSVAQPAGGSLGGLFNRPGVVGGFSAGFLGAGVLGLVFGHGMTDELTSTASFLGLIFQVTLILMLARLFWTWWRVDRSAAFAEMSPRQLADAYGRLRNEAVPDIDVRADAGLGTGLGETKNSTFE
jgi:hypothetical protein